MCCCRPSKGHTRALLWKNLLLWRRTPCISMVEVLSPVLLCVLLVYVRTQVDYQVVPSLEIKEVMIEEGKDLGYTAVYHYPFAEEPRMNMRDEEKWMEDHYQFAGVIPRSRLFFIPRACFWTGNYATQRRFVGLTPRNEYTESIAFGLHRWTQLWKREYGYILDLEYIFFDSTEDMFAYVEHDLYMIDIENRIGLCFGISHSEDTDGDGFTEHRFDLHFDDQESSRYRNIPSQLLPGIDIFADTPDFDSYKKYVRQGFNLVQNWCANAVLRAKLFNLDANIISMVKPMQTNEFVKDDFVIAQKQILPLIMVVIFLLPIYKLISQIVSERVNKTKDVARSMGVSESAYWLSWFIYYLVGMTLVSLVMAILLTFLVFKYSELLLVFAVLWLYGLSLFGYILFIQALFPKPTLASIVGSLLFFASSFVDIIVRDPHLDEHYKLLASLVPSITIQRCFDAVAELERTRQGLTMETVNQKVQNYHVSYGLAMFGFFFMFFSVLGIYLTQILPHAAGGFRENLCYCLLLCDKRHRNGKRQQENGKNEDLEGNNKKDERNFQVAAKKEQQRDPCTLQIQNLTKHYGDVKAVNGLSVEMYKGEIFALLGHNGAGKTTTIKMIIGLIESTRGRMIFQKMDLALNRRHLHHQIGVCPQENILYDQLTVLEHFQLFSALRAPENQHIDGLEHSNAKIEQLILDLDLSDYRNTQAKNLSGGNKRKLQVGLAFVGDSCKLILLDEPTAGLDISARRRMWDMLMRYKRDRVIILTTHYMDEAEILGDRIGIMSQGRLVCLGTTDFLKQRFGTGSSINFEVEEREELTAFVAALRNENDGQDIRIRWAHDNRNKVSLLLPHIKDQQELTSILKKLEAQTNLLGLSSMEITTTTLEQVFIKVASERFKSKSAKNAAVDQLVEFEAEESGSIKRLKSQIREEIQSDRGCLFCKHAGLIISKRTKIYKRSCRTLMLEIFIPLALVLSGFYMSKIQLLYESDRVQLSTDLFGDESERILVNRQVVSPAQDAILDYRDEETLLDESVLFDRTRFGIRRRDLQGSIFDFTHNQHEDDDEDKGDEEDDDDVSPRNSIFDFQPVDDPDTEPEPEDNDGEKNDEDTKTPTDDGQDKTPDIIFEKIEEPEPEDNIDPNATIWDEKRLSTSIFGNGQKSPDRFSMDPALGDEHLTAEMFVSALPESRKSFVPQYLDYDNTEDNVGFQGRDTWKAMEKDVYQAQFNDELMDEADIKAFGAYFLYELNNSTKQFKVGTLVNTTQPNAAALYPQFMYESIIRLATGDPKLKFTTVNSPWPVPKYLQEQEKAVSSIFLVFVITISFALMQASTIAFICHEKERNLKHMQFIQGMSAQAYWLINFFFDLLKTLLVSGMVLLLIHLFSLDFPDAWTLLIAYPFAIVPFTYATSFLFTTESVAQNCTIFSHLILGSVASSTVFILRIIKQTEDQGDSLNEIMKMFPSYALSSGMLYSSSKQLLNETREYTADELFNATTSVRATSMAAIEKAIAEMPARTNITLEAFDMANIGGDLAALGCHCLLFIFLLVICETGMCAIRCKARKARQAVREREATKLIEVRELRKTYSSNPCCKKKAETEALIETNFHVSEHECFSLLGENGAGKSTSFKILTSEVLSSGGDVELLGLDIEKNKSQISRELGYCPQEDVLFDLLTVEEHLDFYARVRCLLNSQDHIDVLIETLSLQHERKKLSMNLSGGNKRKLSVAIALIGKPRLILLDEPSTGVDPDARQHMWQTIKAFQQIGQRSSCILLTTHSMEEAETLSSRLAIMTKGGKLACQGSTLQIKNEHGQMLHVNLCMQASAMIEDVDFDETNVNMADNERDDNVRGEIFNQMVWSKNETIEMLKNKGMTHLAAQVNHKGIFCPEALLGDAAVIQANDLWNWFHVFSELFNSIQSLLLDSRILSVQVLPQNPGKDEESKQEHRKNPNAFTLQVEKDISGEVAALTKVELVVKLGQMQSIEHFDVSETSLERIFQQFIQTEDQRATSMKQQKMALKFSNAAYRCQDEMSTGRKEGSHHKAHVKEPQQETTFIMTQLDQEDGNGEPLVVTQNAYHHDFM